MAGSLSALTAAIILMLWDLLRHMAFAHVGTCLEGDVGADRGDDERVRFLKVTPSRGNRRFDLRACAFTEPGRGQLVMNTAATVRRGYLVDRWLRSRSAARSVRCWSTATKSRRRRRRDRRRPDPLQRGRTRRTCRVWRSRTQWPPHRPSSPARRGARAWWR